jgi:rhodanese-related sulfurtransferase
MAIGPMPHSISPAELHARLERGDPLHLLDVRQPVEHALAALPGSQLLPLHDLPQRWRDVKPLTDALVVCFCHHGVRSWHAAAFLEQCGFSPVYSLTGGIDAWSREIDPTVPRYQ